MAGVEINHRSPERPTIIKRPITAGPITGWFKCRRAADHSVRVQPWNGTYRKKQIQTIIKEQDKEVIDDEGKRVLRRERGITYRKGGNTQPLTNRQFRE